MWTTRIVRADVTEKGKPWLPPKAIIPGLVILASLACSGWMIWLASVRQEKGTGLTAVETALFQTIIAILGLAGSFYFSRATSNTPQNAKSAFRRLVSLYEGLGTFLTTIEARRRVLIARAEEKTISLDNALDTLDILEVQIREKLQTIDDAVADWRDLAPTK